MTRWWLIVLATMASVVLGCRRDHALTPPSTRSVLRELARCTFDEVNGDPTGAEIEAGVRRGLRADRNRFAVRAGNCGSVLDPATRARDSGLRALGDAWDELLPAAQASIPDDLLIERAIRHVGNAWRAVGGSH